MKNLLLISIFTLSSFSQAILINEAKLKEMVFKNTPADMRISSKLDLHHLAVRIEKDSYTPHFFGEGKYKKTKEAPFITGFPVYSPEKSFGIGIYQKIPFGMNLKAQTYNITRSFNPNSGPAISNRAQTVIQAGIEMDLLTNFLGRMDLAKLHMLQADHQSAKLERNIQSHQLYIQTRKIYWALVANQKAQLTTTKLLSSAKIQVSKAKKRLAGAVADEGEVARFEAQLSTRKAELLALKYKQEDLETHLKNIIPSLEAASIQLGMIDEENIMGMVLSCTHKVSSFSETPLNNTQYDEIIQSMRDSYQQKEILTDSYNYPDVKFNIKAKTTGVGNGLSKSYSDGWNNERDGIEFGLSLNIPLDHQLTQTKKIKSRVEKKLFEANTFELLNKLKVTHQQFQKLITYLNQIIDSQNHVRSQLQIRVKSMEKKYNQGRVSVTSYVQEQEGLLGSELSVIETQLMIINVVLDYFSLFNQTPCSFNS